MATFGGNLKSIRTSRALSQEKLAGLMRVNRTQISSWEHDRYGRPATATLFKLAKALKCSVEDLLEEIDQEYTESQRKGPVSRIVAEYEEDVVYTAQMFNNFIAATQDDPAKQAMIAEMRDNTIARMGRKLAILPPTDDEREILDTWRSLAENDQEIIKIFMGRLTGDDDAALAKTALDDADVTPERFREMTAAPKKQAAKTPKRKPG